MDMSSETMGTTGPQPKKKSGFGIVILIVLALIIVGIVLGMRDTKQQSMRQESSTQTVQSNDDQLYNDVDTMDQNLNSVQFEGSADTL